MKMATSKDNNQGSEEVEEMYCEFCKKTGKSLSADGFCVDCVRYFCSACLRYHSEFLPTHVEKDKSCMPHDVCLKPCKIHVDEIIKFYCSRCVQFFCDRCRQKDHRNCSDVRHVPELVDEIDLNAMSDNSLADLEKVVLKLDERQENIEEIMLSVAACATQAKEALAKQKDAVVAFIQNQFSNLEDKIHEYKDADTAKLQSTKKEVDSLKNQAKEMAEEINEQKKKKKRCELFITLKMTEGKRKKLRQSLDTVDKGRMTKYQFHPTSNFATNLTEQSLGSINLSKQLPETDPIKTDTTSVPLAVEFPDAEIQVSTISKALKRPPIKGESWFLISSTWWKCWKSYIGFDSLDQEERLENHPGPINNANILQDGTSKLKDNLIDELNYVLVPQSAWTNLLKWYGMVPGQEPIQRKVIEEGVYTKSLKVEIYLWDFKLASFPDEDQFVVKALSRATTIGELEEVMRETFNIPPDLNVRVWNRYMTNMYQPLPAKEKSLQDAGLYQGHVVVVELQNPDGSWPRVSQHYTVT